MAEVVLTLATLGTRSGFWLRSSLPWRAWTRGWGCGSGRPYLDEPGHEVGVVAEVVLTLASLGTRSGLWLRSSVTTWSLGHLMQSRSALSGVQPSTWPPQSSAGSCITTSPSVRHFSSQFSGVLYNRSRRFLLSSER